MVIGNDLPGSAWLTCRGPHAVYPAPEALVVVLIGGIVVMLVFVFAYSYRVWEMDPAKRQA